MTSIDQNGRPSVLLPLLVLLPLPPPRLLVLPLPLLPPSRPAAASRPARMRGRQHCSAMPATASAASLLLPSTVGSWPFVVSSPNSWT